MGVFKKMEQEANRVSKKKSRKPKQRLISGEVHDSIEGMIKLLGPLSNSMKSKIIKPALVEAANLVIKQAKVNILGNSYPKPSYGTAAPGDSKKTKTRDKWSTSTKLERDGGSHDDLSKSLKVKALKIIRRQGSPVVVILGCRHDKFGLAHMLEFGSGGYTKPEHHYLWSKEKSAELDDIKKIRARPFLEPAAKSTANAQIKMVGKIMMEKWPKA